MPPQSLHPAVAIGPFAKWGVDFMTCNSLYTTSHHYIIMVIDYFTKWVEVMPTTSNDGTMEYLFIFNHVIERFGILKDLVTDHGSHFQNHKMEELAYRLGFHHGYSSPYYHQVNGKVEAIKKILKAMLWGIVDKNKSNWHVMLFLSLWAY